MSLFSPEDLVFRYTRKDAIRDGVLIDLSQGEFGALLHNAGFRYPTAMTDTAFKQYVTVTPAMRQAGQTEQGRLWAVLKGLGLAVGDSQAKQVQTDTLLFHFYTITETNQAVRCQLKVVAGHDDDGNPCVTIMLPNED